MINFPPARQLAYRQRSEVTPPVTENSSTSYYQSISYILSTNQGNVHLRSFNE